MKKQNKILIFFASALLFGYAYGFDLPQALQNPLREQPYNYTNLQFNLMYFFTFLPVVLFQIPIGILIDKYPIQRSLFFFVFLSFVSTLLSGIVFECMMPGYKWIINFTRSTFGVCGQALFTVQAIILTYFAKQQYQISMGICLCLPFVFDALNSVVTTHIYDLTKYMALVWYIAASVCFLSILAAFAVKKKYLSQLRQIQRSESIINEDLMITQSIIETQASQQQSINQTEVKQDEQFHCQSIKRLNSQFWVICGAIFFFQAALGPYFDNLNDMIVKRFGISYTDAGKMILIPEALLVFFGYSLSKICTSNPKWRRKIILIVSVLYFIFITIIYLLPNTANPSSIYYIVICIFLLLMSMMFACEYCALIGSTSYFVHKSELGTAYGIAATALGTCQCIGPLFNSLILDQYEVLQDSYSLLSLFGAVLSVFPIIFAVCMLRRQFQILDYNLKDDFTQKKLQKIKE